MLGWVRTDPELALVVDTCELTTGRVRQVVAAGEAEILPFDVPRGQRMLRRYLGDDEAVWDPRFRRYLRDDPATSGAVWLRIRPRSLRTTDLSYVAAPDGS